MNRPSPDAMWSALVGMSLLVVILVSPDLDVLAADSASPPKPPTAQEDKSKTGEAGEVQERSVKRPRAEAQATVHSATLTAHTE